VTVEHSNFMRTISADCRFFLGDRPCVWHKREGALCACVHYEPVRDRVLIVKLDAMGDVLRTTALLPPLAKAHPGSAVTWITKPESVPLLARNPYVSEVMVVGPDAIAQLSVRQFDRVINLDAGRTSAALASLARASRKDGFVLDARGIVNATNSAALSWLEAGLFDDIKRQGDRTYQDRMADILGVAGEPHHYVFELADDERARARAHLLDLGLDLERPLIGLNTGAGGRWPLKQWREEGYVELVTRLAAQIDAQFVLLGGPGEVERNERLKTAAPVTLFDPGCDNPIRHFAAMLGFCDVVITGDTLAMHLALALKRRTVVLFGPTSAPEIELYNLGEKVVPTMSCLSCYKTSCDFVPNCMDLISTDMVEAAVHRQLALTSRRQPALVVAPSGSPAAQDTPSSPLPFKQA
jgi:ADP-heptose:LPS heptosyltransferase